MATRQKISQMTPKGADLEATDLLEVSVVTGTGYGTYSITGQEIINAASGGAFVPYTGATTDVDLGEFELKAGQLELDQTPTGTATSRQLPRRTRFGDQGLGAKSAALSAEGMAALHIHVCLTVK